MPNSLSAGNDWTDVCGENPPTSPCDDARAGEVSLVDEPPQIDSEEGRRAEVAHRREAGLEGLSRVDHRDHRRREGCVLEREDVVDVIGARGEVDMAVDEPGEDRVGGEIDERGAARDGNVAAGGHALDAVARDDEGDVVPERVTGAVEEVACADVRDARPGGRRRRRRCCSHRLGRRSTGRRRRGRRGGHGRSGRRRASDEQHGGGSEASEGAHGAGHDTRGSPSFGTSSQSAASPSTVT
jgi:hypothetical protein